MYSIKNDFLDQKKMIGDIFELQGLDPEKEDVYKYIEGKFQTLFQNYADVFNLDDYVFYIERNSSCNAFAFKMADCSFIGITSGYLSLLESAFDEKYFLKILIVAIINEKSVSEAFCDLHEDPNFKFNEFMRDCSIQFTFSHEFQHILQLNRSKLAHDFRYNENLDTANFDLTNHAWEFDADRMASFEVLKYIFSVHKKLKKRNAEKLKCIIYVGLASIVITKNLFYFGVMDQLPPKHTVDKQEFYTKKFSHPHPLVRIHNILEYFYENIKSDFPQLKIESQEILNNSLAIAKIYFDSLIPDQDVMREFFEPSKSFLDEIIQYNQELYDFAIKDKAIRTLLKVRRINF